MAVVYDVSMSVLKKVGIFAGAFDPIHNGHIEVANSALSQANLDSVYFMIEGSPWGDKQPVSLVDRENMVDLAIFGQDKLSRLTATEDRFDISTTLKSLESRFADYEMSFIFGADVFIKMNSISWPNLNRLLEHRIIIFQRHTIDSDDILPHAKALNTAVTILPSKHSKYSSTEVRVSRGDKSIWVPKKVAEYMKINSLY